jgi:DNA-binding CsgD family transcriptional regulator
MSSQGSRVGAVGGIRKTANLCHAGNVTLRARDLGAALAFVADAHAADGPEALTRELLDRLTELFGCEYATYETYDRPRRTMTGYVSCSNEDPPAGALIDVPESFLRGDNWRRWGGPSVASHKLSDWFDRRERERLRDETEFNAEFRIVDALGIRVGDKQTRSALLHFESQRRDFDERDRELALRPHVEALWRNAASRKQVATILAELERDGDAAAHAIVLLGPSGRIDHATSGAQRLLAEWFGVRDGPLPAELRDWLALASPGDRYTERRNGSILTVEAANNSTLTLRERMSAEGELTPREREVLALVAEGLSNTEIARRLWVAPSTVAKHLEQAYRKLGVSSRTAAGARVAKLSDWRRGRNDSARVSAGNPVVERRGRDLNPRRTKPPETVFEIVWVFAP